MDIVSLFPPTRRRQKRARRHTTEVRLADLPTSEDTEKEFEQPSALHYSDAESSSLKGVASEGELKSSWDSLDAEATGIHYEGSQVEEMSLRSTSHVDHVIMEIISTEETYVQDLTDIIQGYISPLESQIGTLHIDMVDIDNIFGNVKDIKDFNMSVLNSLKECRCSSKGVGQCFLDKAEGFKSHYSVYCNNYPKAVRSRLMPGTKLPSIGRWQSKEGSAGHTHNINDRIRGAAGPTASECGSTSGGGRFRKPA
ncbi:Pleckstrin homology domain-containing family G member 1 [Geodia barretti]|uniref:Pleckstrin homology domain-containing family G member 1 n=1 Tax=Geodia barretti TaxID=519541 RepID=A0AA35WHA2_GEOBA|nr:Pleckstrin homology domain-containing family G member 1 [Geodia barretti]